MSSSHRSVACCERSASPLPAARMRPSAMITRSSQSRSTMSSWCDENSTGAPDAATSASTPCTVSTAIGSRPENGSSSTSTSGRCTSAAAICARCWLPSERLSIVSSVRSPRPRRSSSSSALRRAAAGRPAVQAGEVHGLLEQAHLRVQAALLGHVAEAAAVGVGERGAAEGHRAAVGREHAEDDPHRGGLAGAVAADEAGEAAVADGEAHRVEGEALAVALGDVVEFEHEITATDVAVPRGIRRATGFAGSAVRGRAARPVRESWERGFRMSEALVSLVG